MGWKLVLLVYDAPEGSRIEDLKGEREVTVALPEWVGDQTTAWIAARTIIKEHRERGLCVPSGYVEKC